MAAMHAKSLHVVLDHGSAQDAELLRDHIVAATVESSENNVDHDASCQTFVAALQIVDAFELG